MPSGKVPMGLFGPQEKEMRQRRERGERKKEKKKKGGRKGKEVNFRVGQ